MLPVLDLDPAIGAAAAIDALAMLRDHAFQSHQAGMPEQIRAISPCSKSDRKMPSTRRASSRASDERQPAEILAVAHQDIERVELHLGIVPARVQAVEVAAAVD